MPVERAFAIADGQNLAVQDPKKYGICVTPFDSPEWMMHAVRRKVRYADSMVTTNCCCVACSFLSTQNCQQRTRTH